MKKTPFNRLKINSFHHYHTKVPAYLARDTCVSRPSSVRITPEIRAYHERDTLGIFACAYVAEYVIG